MADVVWEDSSAACDPLREQDWESLGFEVSNDLEAEGGLSWDAVSTSISGDSDMPSAPPSSDIDGDMLDAHRPSKVSAESVHVHPPASRFALLA
jgi:hypothetical protein